MEFTSMIDVVFLMLIFFMCTLKFKTLENKISTYLPAHGGKPVVEDYEPIEKIRLKVSMSGDRCLCAVNGRVVATLPKGLSKVYEQIHRIRSASPGSPTEIDPDPAVPHKHVVSLIDECIRAKVSEILFTAPLPALKIQKPHPG